MTPNTTDFISAWVAALRSGEYTQTTQHLRDSVGYCCLGVACEVYAKLKASPIKWEADADILTAFSVTLDGETINTTGLPTQFLGFWLSIDEMHYLAEKNDAGDTFAEIADYIEKYYRRERTRKQAI